MFSENDPSLETILQYAIKPRKYQLELVREASKTNTICVCPTGMHSI